jgi:hypothetical protein
LAVRAAPTAVPRRADALVVTLFAAAVRAAVVIWGSSRFPPAEDGKFYDIVARRIADGLGYTWLWPDGAVTYAAHYPVGYPGIIGGLYAAFGHAPVVAMTFNAAIGAGTVYATHRVASVSASRWGALLAALLVALHPTLVFYTPALMTEAISAALVIGAIWIVTRAGAGQANAYWAVALGVVLGVGTLIRPQLLLLSPVFGAALSPKWRQWRTLTCAVVATAVTLAVCAPWTARNCARMERCVFVSANGGWNLLIGSGRGATGMWVPIEQVGMPKECKTVFGEVDKDVCFGEAAAKRIAADVPHWLSLVPRKLSATFDYVGAAAWYLHSANAAAFPEARKLQLGIAETAWQRLVVLFALVAVARVSGPWRRARLVVCGIAIALLFQAAAWMAHLLLIAAVCLLGRALWSRPAALLVAWSLATTALTHAVFFGAGRYSVVVFAALAALAGGALPLASRTPATTEAQRGRA